MNYLIKNATLVNEGQTFVASVFVSDGKIAKIIREGDDPSTDEITGFDMELAHEIDATGKYLIPGIISVNRA